MNRQLDALNESFTIALADRVRQLKQRGVPVIALQTGDPDFNTPDPIIQRALHAMQNGATHYSNSRGLIELRQAIATHTHAQTGIAYDPQREVLVTHGAIHAYHVALQAILNAGESVLVPDPSWQTHANMVRLLGGQAIRVPAHPETDFFPTLEAWQNALTPQTVALVLNSPNNPTGMVAQEYYLRQLVDFARANKLYILSDEVYDQLLYDDARHISLASLAPECTILLNSFSKTFAMTGWRIGYLCAPAPIVDNALKASQHTVTNVAAFIQEAALFALQSPEMAQATHAMRHAYAQRRQLVLQEVAQAGANPVKVLKPMGAFYFFLDVRQMGLTSMQIAERLLDEAQVALVAGSAYGACGEGFLRMTIAAHESDIQTGIRKVLAWAQKS